MEQGCSRLRIRYGNIYCRLWENLSVSDRYYGRTYDHLCSLHRPGFLAIGVGFEPIREL